MMSALASPRAPPELRPRPETPIELQSVATTHGDPSRPASRSSAASLPVLQAGRSSEPPADADAAPAMTIPESSNARKVAICLSAFAVIFTTCGTLFSFGVYQEMYQEMSQRPGTPFSGASPAEIDLVGTLATAFMTIPSPLATAWTKLFGPRAVICGGAVLFFTASMLASFSTQLWQFVLAQGLILGCGVCLSYIPAVTVAPTWYGARRGLALGIILSGTGAGGVAWAPAIHALNVRFGFRNALRISGAISTALIALSGATLSWDPVSEARLAAERARARRANTPLWVRVWSIPLVDWRIARSAKFVSQFLASALQAAAYNTPVFFFSAYAKTLGYTPAQGANFIALNNAMNAVGKIVIGIAADRWGRLNMLLATTAISAVASLTLWLPSTLVLVGDARSMFIAYTVLYGFFASAYVSLFPASIVEVFGPQNFASVNGVLYMSRGIATLIGTPTSGALLRGSHATDPSAYLGMTALVGALLFCAAVSVVWVRAIGGKR